MLQMLCREMVLRWGDVVPAFMEFLVCNSLGLELIAWGLEMR